MFWPRWISSSYRPRHSARSSFCSFWLASPAASVHFAVTDSPSAAWTAQQVAEAFPWEEAPRCLSRDRDATYSMVFRERVKRMGIAELITAARSPLQNPYVECVSRTIRRELLTHATLLDKRHLQPRLRVYVDYYQPARTHLSLDKDTPELRAVEPVSTGPIRAVAEVGGLHHRYFRRAA